MAPDVGFERRDVEVADDDGARRRRRPQQLARAHLVEEGELVGEFRIDRRIGNVAARRHVEIMQRDRVLEAGALTEHDRNVPAVVLAAKRLDRAGLERQPRQHDDAVMAFLAVERDVLVAEPLEALEREPVVRALGLLQAQDIGTHRFDEFGDEIDAEADGIDVPGRDGQFHAAN